MKRVMAITAVLVSILLILVFAAGCKRSIAERLTEKAVEKAVEGAIESESGGEVDIDLDEGQVNIQSDEGEISYGTGSDLPEGFPSNVPLYNNMTIMSSWTQTMDGKAAYSIAAVSDDSVDEIFNWYKSELSNWDIEGEFTMSTDAGKSSSLTAKNGGQELTLSVTDSEEETLINQSVMEE